MPAKNATKSSPQRSPLKKFLKFLRGYAAIYNRILKGIQLSLTKVSIEVQMRTKSQFISRKTLSGFQFMMGMEEPCALNFWKIICINFSLSLIGKMMSQPLWEKPFWWLKKAGKKKATTAAPVPWLFSSTKILAMLRTSETQGQFLPVKTAKSFIKLPKITNHRTPRNKKEWSNRVEKYTKRLQSLRLMENTTIKLLDLWEFFLEDFRQQEHLEILKQNNQGLKS